jgi:hypothetical protein
MGDGVVNDGNAFKQNLANVSAHLSLHNIGEKNRKKGQISYSIKYGCELPCQNNKGREHREAQLVTIVSLDETPSIDINDITLPLDSQDIKPANRLTKRSANFSSDLSFLGRQLNDVSNFFAIQISLDNPIDHGRLSRLRMDYIWAKSIDLDVLVIVCLHELFVYERSFGAWI